MSVMNPISAHRTSARQHGFTLLEVLITLVVFSVGLLGIAGLQMTGMKQTHNSHLRSLATTQAMDMADRMRANMEGVENGDYDKVYANCNANCETGECDAAKMAEFDVCEWAKETVAALPSGAARVCLDATPAPTSAATDWSTGFECSGTGNIYAVKIQWTERTLDSDDQGTNTTSLRHYYMRVTP